MDSVDQLDADPPMRKRSGYTENEYEELLQRCDDLVTMTTEGLDQTSDLLGKMGESILSPLKTMQGGMSASAATTTGGHSNTDHIIVWTNDYETDRIEELKRNLVRRIRSQQPESRGEDRWDKPRIFGERRRRIVREKDSPEAPAYPPLTGYIIFVGQMTAKIRHDNPNVQHSQTAVVQEISKLWRISLSDEERHYYTDFSERAREEHRSMDMEFRSTGAFRPSRSFLKLQGVGPWIHVREEERNSLEKEIATYETVQFPPRPPEFDEAFKIRDIESKRRRKLKLKGLLNSDGTERTEPDMSLALVRVRTRRKSTNIYPSVTGKISTRNQNEKYNNDDVENEKTQDKERQNNASDDEKVQSDEDEKSQSDEDEKAQSDEDEKSQRDEDEKAQSDEDYKKDQSDEDYKDQSDEDEKD